MSLIFRIGENIIRDFTQCAHPILTTFPTLNKNIINSFNFTKPIQHNQKKFVIKKKTSITIYKKKT